MAETVDLDKLKEEITALGEKIRELKSASEVDKTAIGAAVNDLLAAKKKYAENNNGIGADGKPYEAPLTKAEKKAKAKAEKAAAAAKAAAGAGGNGKGEVSHMLSVIVRLVVYLTLHTVPSLGSVAWLSQLVCPEQTLTLIAFLGSSCLLM